MTKAAPIEIHDAGQGITHLYRGNKKMGSIFDDGSLCSLKTGGVQRDFRNRNEALKAIKQTFGPVVKKQTRLSPEEAIDLEDRICRLASRIGAGELSPSASRRITPDSILEAGIKMLMGANAHPGWFDRVKRMMVNEVLRGTGQFVPMSFDQVPERNRILQEAIEAKASSQAVSNENPIEAAFKTALSAIGGKTEAAEAQSPAEPAPETKKRPTQAAADMFGDLLYSPVDSIETPVAAEPDSKEAVSTPGIDEPAQPSTTYAYTRGKRFTSAEADEIRRRIVAKEETMRSAAKRLNISTGMISKIVDGLYKPSDK